MREGKLGNIAFNANATGGGEIKTMITFFSQFASEMILPYNLQVVMVGIGSATYDQIEYDLAFTMEGALGLVGGTMGPSLDFLSSVVSKLSIILKSTLASLFPIKERNNLVTIPFNPRQQNYYVKIIYKLSK